MIEIKRGSLISKLLYVLTITGEFPMCSISLLGSYRRNMQLIKTATKSCEYLNFETKERYTTTLLTIVGQGRRKSLRLLSGAERILEWLGFLELFQETRNDFHYRGDRAHVDRAHRVAEGYAMAYLAGLEINPIEIPKLQQESIKNLFIDKQCFYGSKQLKVVSKLEMKKNIYTRIIGAVFANKNVYAVYNTRSTLMKWNGKGESKTLVNLEEISRMNAGGHRISSAILFGKNEKVALETLETSEKTTRLELCFDGIYPQLYFVPLNENGVRQLRILLLENWREELLSSLFNDEIRSFDEGGIEYDASIGRKFILEFFDGNITRLQRFRFGAKQTKGDYEVLCFPFQVELVKGYLGDLAKIKTIDLEVIENALEIGGEN